MATRSERTTTIDKLEQEFKGASGIYLANNNKITVAKTTKLRSDLRKMGVKFLVVKNTLARAAAVRCGRDALSPHFKGPTAVAIARTDGTAPAKVLRDFQKDNKDLLEVRCAYVDGAVFTGAEVLKLADLPSREVLLAQLLGCLKAPVGNLAGVLSGILGKFALTLEAVKEKKAAAGQ